MPDAAWECLRLDYGTMQCSRPMQCSRLGAVTEKIHVMSHTRPTPLQTPPASVLRAPLQVYCQVLYDVFDPYICNFELGTWHPRCAAWAFTRVLGVASAHKKNSLMCRNVIGRCLVRGIYIILICFISCLLPFFANFLVRPQSSLQQLLRSCLMSQCLLLTAAAGPDWVPVSGALGVRGAVLPAPRGAPSLPAQKQHLSAPVRCAYLLLWAVRRWPSLALATGCCMLISSSSWPSWASALWALQAPCGPSLSRLRASRSSPPTPRVRHARALTSQVAEPQLLLGVQPLPPPSLRCARGSIVACMLPAGSAFG